MTSKDYIAIAEVIRESFAFHTVAQRAVFTLDMEKVLRADNPKRWNSQLWHNACRAEVTT